MHSASDAVSTFSSQSHQGAVVRVADAS